MKSSFAYRAVVEPEKGGKTYAVLRRHLTELKTATILAEHLRRRTALKLANRFNAPHPA